MSFIPSNMNVSFVQAYWRCGSCGTRAAWLKALFIRFSL